MRHEVEAAMNGRWPDFADWWSGGRRREAGGIVQQDLVDLQGHGITSAVVVALDPVGQQRFGGQRFGAAEEDGRHAHAGIVGRAQFQLQVAVVDEPLGPDIETSGKERRRSLCLCSLVITKSLGKTLLTSVRTASFDSLGWHGKDPTMDSGFKKLNPYGPTTKETGHSGYLVDGGEAQIKIAKVVLGTAG